MLKNFYSFADSLKIFKKHKLIVFLLIVQVIICLCLTGIIANKISITDKNVQEYEDKIFSKEYYKLAENFDDIFFYSYMDDSYKFKEINNYLNDLRKEFNYLIITNQPIAIKNFEIPQTGLVGYENAASDNSITTDKNGTIIYSTKSLQVSQNFFNEFSIKPQKGKFWDEDVVKYKKGSTIPIALGADYSDVQIGEQIDGVYLDEHVTFEVVAILESGSSWTTGEYINYTDRYVVIPSIVVNEDDTSEFSKMRLLQQICGYIINKKEHSDITQTIKQLANKNNLPYGLQGVSIVDNEQELNILETYSKMTDNIKEQFILLFVALVSFVVISLSFTINGFVRRHYYEFGVRLLNGATIHDISLIIIQLLILIVGTSSLIATIILILTKNFSAYIIVLASALILLSAIIPVLHVKHFDVSTIICGKE